MRVFTEDPRFQREDSESRALSSAGEETSVFLRHAQRLAQKALQEERRKFMDDVRAAKSETASVDTDTSTIRSDPLSCTLLSVVGTHCAVPASRHRPRDNTTRANTRQDMEAR